MKRRSNTLSCSMLLPFSLFVLPQPWAVFNTAAVMNIQRVAQIIPPLCAGFLPSSFLPPPRPTHLTPHLPSLPGLPHPITASIPGVSVPAQGSLPHHPLQIPTPCSHLQTNFSPRSCFTLLHNLLTSFFLYSTITIWHFVYFTLIFYVRLSPSECKFQELRNL